MEQRELVRRAAGGDADAFAVLAGQHVDRCYALAFRILRDPDRAHDATQRALIGAWRDLSGLRDPDRLEAWLYRLVVNAAYVEARSDRRWSARIRVIAMEPSSPDIASSVADRDTLERAFARLSPEQRAVVVLHHHFGYPLTEIAAILSIPDGTARSRLHTAVRTLRAAIDVERQIAMTRERPA